ncbi:MAG: aldehyde ferredoxin oxidoreductase N-terminal domain-containing protein [Candidatus Hodarchaeota archaeon]
MVGDSSSAETVELVSCDLSTQRVRKEEIPRTISETFWAGRPLASFLAYNRLGRRSDALGEKNHIFICPGLLGQTTAIVTRSPLKYGLSVSVIGPPFGELLAKAGISILDIWGSAKEPNLLIVTGSRVEFQDGSSLWGLPIEETRSDLLDQFPGHDSLIIGPSGEKALRIAAVAHGYHQLGEDGLGAVFGSKNLKAVLVAGDLTATPLDLEDGFLMNDIFLSPHGKLSQPANNFSMLSSEPFPGVWPGAISPSGWAFLGPNLGIYDKEPILAAGKYCFEQGFSLRFVGAVLGVFTSLVEKGRITGYPNARFGSESLYNMIKFMLDGKGIPHQMTFGPESLVTLRGEKAPTVKGEMGLGIHPAASTGYALNLAVGNPLRTIIPSIEFLDLPFSSDCHSWNNKGRFICWAEDYLGGCDALGLPMRFAVTHIKKWPLSGIVRAISSSVFLKHGFALPDSINSQLEERSVSITLKDLLILGARTVAVERLFGTREGLTGSDDRLPDRFLAPKGPTTFSSAVLSRQDFFRAKGAYYRQRGLLPSGLPSLETLRELGLEKLIAL